MGRSILLLRRLPKGPNENSGSGMAGDESIPLARCQVEGIARAITTKYWRLVRAQHPDEPDEDQVVVVAQSAGDADHFQRMNGNQNPDGYPAGEHSGLSQLPTQHDPELPSSAPPLECPSILQELQHKLEIVIRNDAVKDLVRERETDEVARESIQLFKKECEALDKPGIAKRPPGRPLFHNRGGSFIL